MNDIKSLNCHRLAFHSIEQRLVDSWAEQNIGGRTLEYILSGIYNRSDPVSDRDKEVAVTMIQWIGTPIGQAFLEEALGIGNLRDLLASRWSAHGKSRIRTGWGARVDRCAAEYEKACRRPLSSMADGD